MRPKDYYRILDVGEDATAAEIKKAYRRLARRFHPDVSVIKDAEERFKEVAEAYEILKDPEKRIAYDCFGCGSRDAPDWERQFGEIFGSEDGACSLDALFDRFRRGSAEDIQSECAAPGDDGEITVRITLEEAARGTDLELELSEPGGRRARLVRVRVPKGAYEDQRLEVPDKDAQDHDGVSSRRLHVRIAFLPHPLFCVHGYDLTMELPLSPWEAALGTSLEVPTLEGRVRLKVPPGTQSHDKLRLAGHGMMMPGGDAGDLYLRARIVTPGVLTEREKQLYAELACASTFAPRAHLV